MAHYSMASSRWGRFGNLFGGLTSGGVLRPQSQPSASDLREERAFINEMIWSNPEAFSSELDVQNMMSLYPSRF